MTDVPDQHSRPVDEPPFDTLYALYLDSLAYDRKKWATRFADDPAQEERVAMLLQPKPPARFREYLDECAARGARGWVVNCLVLGPEYCDTHPDDPRIQPPPGETAQMEEEFTAGFASALGEDRRAGGWRRR